MFFKVIANSLLIDVNEKVNDEYTSRMENTLIRFMCPLSSSTSSSMHGKLRRTSQFHICYYIGVQVKRDTNDFDKFYTGWTKSRFTENKKLSISGTAQPFEFIFPPKIEVGSYFRSTRTSLVATFFRYHY